MPRKGCQYILTAPDDNYFQVMQTKNLVEPSRFSDLFLRKGQDLFLVLNVYLPSGDINGQLNHLYRLCVILKCFRELNSNDTCKVIIGGDFNCTARQEDSSNTNVNPNLPLFKEMFLLLVQQGLSDSMLEPLIKNNFADAIFTNNTKAGGTARRLDYLFVSEIHLGEGNISYSRSLSNFPGSTHHSISLSFNPGVKSPAHHNQDTNSSSSFVKQPFRFNNQVLRNKDGLSLFQGSHFFEENFCEADDALTQYDKLVPSFNEFVENVQSSVLTYQHLGSSSGTQSHSNAFQQIRSNLIYNNPHSLNLLFKKQAKRLRIGFDRQNDSKASELTQTQTLLSEAKVYYEELYAKEPSVTATQASSFLEDFNLRIDHNHRTLLERPVTESELWDSLCHLSKKKVSPGPDGMSYQLLKVCYEDMKVFLRSVANGIMQTGRLPLNLSKVVITLLPKSKYHLTKSFADLRPIALNNSILKLLSHVWNQRLLAVADDMIHHSQVGFLHHRKMENLNLEYSWVYQKFLSLSSQLVKSVKPAGGMLLLDFTKAFDLMDHEYLSLVFNKMGFPQSTLNIIKALTSCQTAVLKINGVLSSDFRLSSGVRQGNPISPTLFVFGIEPLLWRLRHELQGVGLSKQVFDSSFAAKHPAMLPRIRDTSIKTLAYADDVTVFMRDRRDAEKVEALLKKFESAAGMKINEDKTELLLLTRQFKPTATQSNSDNNYIQLPRAVQTQAEFIGFPWSTNAIFLDDYERIPTVLGFPLHSFDWDEKVKKIIRNIQYPLIDDVPTQTRCMGINIYVFSQVYFYDPVHPIPSLLLKQITETIDKEIRGYSMDCLTRIKDLGGFGLVDLSLQLVGHRAKFIYYLFTNSDFHIYRHLRFKLQSFCNLLCDLFRLHPSAPLISVTDSHYYRREDGTRTNQLLVWETNNFNRPRSGSLSQPTLPNPSSSPQASHLQGFPWYELLNGALLRFFNDLPPESYWKTWLSPAEFQYKSTPVKDMWVFLTKVLPSFRLQGDLLALSNWFEDRELVWLESWFQ
ncbi:hypothetical protein WICPIJ_002067, partial [Wickerhamomyces pijperi]